jgi:trk system potassium uptake protein TrkH
LRLRVALQIVGLISILLALAMLAPLFVSLFYKQGDTGTFLYSFLITGSIGAVLFLVFRGPVLEVSHREGFVIVAASWICASLFSSVPYLLSGTFASPVDAVFEAVSGITTTGATILTDIEAMPYGILFWRSMTQWLGGMGIIVLSLIILPFLGIGGMQLYRAEASTISGDKFAPRIQDMAKILLYVYLIVSFTMLVFLILAGMNIYDAFVHTMDGISTAGFSDKNMSVGHFQSVYVEGIIIIFMVLGATNFALHYGFFKKGIRAYTASEEFRFYILVMVVATVLVTVNLNGTVYKSLSESFRYASFQVVSITTTTGYTTADFASWTSFSQLLLLILMFFGGSAGSTTGSIKCIRILLLIKLCYKEMYRLIHPHAVIPVKLGGKVVPPEVMKGVTGFTFLFLLVFIVSAIVLSWVGLDTWTAVSSAAATLSNVGPALGQVGPSSNYSMVPGVGKWVLIVNMLLGRLEIYTLLILLVPAFWKE